jgi:hypothetical protein
MAPKKKAVPAKKAMPMKAGKGKGDGTDMADRMAALRAKRGNGKAGK